MFGSVCDVLRNLPARVSIKKEIGNEDEMSRSFKPLEPFHFADG